MARRSRIGGINFFSGLTYPFDERGWAGKLLGALLVGAVPVLGYFAIKGWEFEISVRVRYGSAEQVSGWGNLPSKLVRGFLIRLAGFIYNLPAFILIGSELVIFVGVILRWLNQPAGTPLPLRELFAEQAPALLAVGLGAGLWWVMASLLYWSGYMRYIDTLRFAAFFEIIPNLKLVFRNVFDDLLVELFVAVLSLLLMLAGSLLTFLLGLTGIGAVLAPFLVPAFVLTVSTYFKGYMFGQLAINTFGPQAREPR